MFEIGYNQSPWIILEDNTASILISEGKVSSAGRTARCHQVSLAEDGH